jgi:glycosyltransferase involved in cell wall biosynthesis
VSNIVIDARTLGSTTGRYAERLLGCLAALPTEHHFTILVQAGFDQSSLPLPAAFQYVIANYPLNGSFREQIGLQRQLQQLHPDLVHFTMPQQPFFFSGKAVTTIHDLTGLRFRNPDTTRVASDVKRLVFGKLIKHDAKRSRQIITPSEFVKRDVLGFTGIDPNKITVTYEAADPIIAPPIALPGLENQQFIMYAGRPTPHKNLERLIEAFGLLRAQHPDLLLVLVGKQDTNYQRIEASVHKQGSKNIIFTGFVGDGQLRWLYEHCAAYAFPSLSEGFGLPALEAMAQGAPVAASNSTCSPEIYGDAAHYFDPTDVQAMADALNEVLTDKILRDKLIAKGKIQAAKYSWRRMAEQTLATYESALSSRT